MSNRCWIDAKSTPEVVRARQIRGWGPGVLCLINPRAHACGGRALRKHLPRPPIRGEPPSKNPSENPFKTYNTPSKKRVCCHTYPWGRKQYLIDSQRIWVRQFLLSLKTDSLRIYLSNTRNTCNYLKWLVWSVPNGRCPVQGAYCDTK